jgi:signal transduction histidine kinase
VSDERTSDLQPPRILVVDDESTNRILLRHMLKPLGCRVEEAESAAQGLRLAREFKPHLFLLDIMMPQTTGFEMCQALKQMPEFADVPVIFITALTDVQEKVRGFAAGGADYICKPFQKEEVAARIRLQLELLAQRVALQRHAENLEEMVQARTRQLLHADRLVTIGTMAAKILHEINNPLSLVMGNLQIVQETWGRFAGSAGARLAGSDRTGFDDTRKLLDDCLADALEGARRIARLADGIRQYSRRNETRTVQVHGLKPLIEEAIRLLQPRLKHQYQVRVEVPEDLRLACDAGRLQQVFMNLMANSADAAPKGVIRFAARAEPGAILLTYEDDGPGIPEELREKIFESFFTTKGPEKGTGIGMTIIQEILREHGGDIVLGRREGPGVRFDIRLDPEGRPKPESGPARSGKGGAA